MHIQHTYDSSGTFLNAYTGTPLSAVITLSEEDIVDF